ncbi:MAG: DUF2288 domain-containing protein [Thiotrichales bacterium]
MTNEELDLSTRLNLDTGRITWPELQRSFARGVVLLVAPDLDLVHVAESFVQDDSVAVDRWIKYQAVVAATLEHAKDWEETQPEFWAVVVAPWVLIQACDAATDSSTGNLNRGVNDR